VAREHLNHFQPITCLPRCVVMMMEQVLDEEKKYLRKGREGK
jgi:hypothetical protein